MTGAAHQMQPFVASVKTTIAFMLDGKQWGERGEFAGSPEVAFPKAEVHLRAMVRAGGWPAGTWILQADGAEKRSVKARRR